MKTKKIITILKFLVIFLMIATSISKVYAYNTDYPEKSVREEEKEKGEEEDKNINKQIGIAVIKKEDVKDVYAYYYLYYDSEGEVHIVEYIQNPIRSQWDENAKDKKRWILKTDADNIKAKELGAKEYYSEEEDIKKEENKDATELFKKITEEVGNKKTLYDYIEGSTEDEEPYTIESILFNKVPIFDVNFFSETAAGKELKSDSIVSIIRKIIAAWYVTFRNIAFIALAILIIYYGIRLAISSVASEKANYKRILIGWLKSIIIVFIIHYIMYAIIYFNETFVNFIANTNEHEVSIYNTIKTRALEAPLKVAVPATILYFTLLFMWIRFIFTYFKRTFTVAFLVILAPLVGIRYSIEGASGKGSQLVTNWIQRFTTAVFIQSIHAMIYVIFVETALETALEDLHGFFIALFFLNFILAADKIFINIFKFQFYPSTADRLRKPFSPAKDLIELKAGYELTKGAFVAGQEILIDTKDTTVQTLDRGFTKVTDMLDDKYGGNHRRDIEDSITNIKDNIDDKIRDKLIGDEVDETGRPIEFGKTKNRINRTLKLRKISRKRGKEGAKAKKALRKQKNITKKRYKSNFKIMRDLGTGVAGAVIAIPMIASSDDPSKGIAMMTKIPSMFITSHKNIKTVQKTTKKADKEFEKTVKGIKIAGKKMDRIEKELDKISGNDRKKALNELKAINSINANPNSIKEAILQYIEKNKITKIDSDELELIISDIVDNMQGDLTDEERKQIKENAKSIILKNRYEEKKKKKTRYETDENNQKEKTPIQATKTPDNSLESDNDSAQETIGFETGETALENIEIDREIEKRVNETQEDSEEYRENTDDRETKYESPESDKDVEKTETGNSSIGGSKTQNNREEKENFTFGEIINGIESAVIEEKTDNKFTADLAKEINSIKDTNDKSVGKLGGRTIADTNRFLDSL
ncbi:MAG: hypothetical protein IKG14_00850 [Clostridia bacterium]|nr:hypothetical protein [Clostridia bacterium]MBR3324584.1 hypothetical protein [Clostridia bacterium]